jgi:hypothetical protein
MEFNSFEYRSICEDLKSKYNIKFDFNIRYILLVTMMEREQKLIKILLLYSIILL